MPRAISRSDFLDAPLQQLHAEPVPELRAAGEEDAPVVYIRSHNGHGRTALGAAIRAAKGETETQVAIVVNTVTDADGVPLFTAADAVTIGERNGALLFRLADKGLELNGFGKAAADAHEKN